LGGCAVTGGGEQNIYVVRPQDTVYSIAWRYGLDYRELARWNKIGPDFRIAVGQTLTLGPQTGTPSQKTNRPASASSQASPGPPAPPGPPASGAAPPASPGAGARPMAPASALPWTWPTDRISSPLPVSGGGILLSGRLGQDIRAACAGRVVYNGTGIRGYGNLIIIKHGENLLSAYAHTREPLVQEGQEVTLGQVIARMGEGAPQKPVLYFEVRRNGKPVDPMSVLPRTK
jgi:lipoprotein NlpD